MVSWTSANSCRRRPLPGAFVPPFGATTLTRPAPVCACWMSVAPIWWSSRRTPSTRRPATSRCRHWPPSAPVDRSTAWPWSSPTRTSPPLACSRDGGPVTPASDSWPAGWCPLAPSFRTSWWSGAAAIGPPSWWTTLRAAVCRGRRMLASTQMAPASTSSVSSASAMNEDGTCVTCKVEKGMPGRKGHCAVWWRAGETWLSSHMTHCFATPTDGRPSAGPPSWSPPTLGCSAGRRWALIHKTGIFRGTNNCFIFPAALIDDSVHRHCALRWHPRHPKQRSERSHADTGSNQRLPPLSRGSHSRAHHCHLSLHAYGRQTGGVVAAKSAQRHLSLPQSRLLPPGGLVSQSLWPALQRRRRKHSLASGGHLLQWGTGRLSAHSSGQWSNCVWGRWYESGAHTHYTDSDGTVETVSRLDSNSFIVPTRYTCSFYSTKSKECYTHFSLSLHFTGTNHTLGTFLLHF